VSPRSRGEPALDPEQGEREQPDGKEERPAADRSPGERRCSRAVARRQQLTQGDGTVIAAWPRRVRANPDTGEGFRKRGAQHQLAPDRVEPAVEPVVQPVPLACLRQQRTAAAIRPQRRAGVGLVAATRQPCVRWAIHQENPAAMIVRAGAPGVRQQGGTTADLLQDGRGNRTRGQPDDPVRGTARRPHGHESPECPSPVRPLGSRPGDSARRPPGTRRRRAPRDAQRCAPAGWMWSHRRRRAHAIRPGRRPGAAHHGNTATAGARTGRIECEVEPRDRLHSLSPRGSGGGRAAQASCPPRTPPGLHGRVNRPKRFSRRRRPPPAPNVTRHRSVAPSRVPRGRAREPRARHSGPGAGRDPGWPSSAGSPVAPRGVAGYCRRGSGDRHAGSTSVERVESSAR
jgi:hypothetical protein